MIWHHAQYINQELAQHGSVGGEQLLYICNTSFFLGFISLFVVSLLIKIVMIILIIYYYYFYVNY